MSEESKQPSDSGSVASHCSSALQHWVVDVRVNGEDVLTIESNSMFGKSDLSPMELDAIRTAANHLLAFAGQPSRHRMNQIMRETNGRFESR